MIERFCQRQHPITADPAPGGFEPDNATRCRWETDGPARITAQ
jgi:hypothetical protein